MPMLQTPLRHYLRRRNSKRSFACDYADVQISEAFQVLSDPEIRSKYDKLGREAAKPAEGFSKSVLSISDKI
jgi:DnaJ-class molecular chaperone